MQNRFTVRTLHTIVISDVIIQIRIIAFGVRRIKFGPYLRSRSTPWESGLSIQNSTKENAELDAAVWIEKWL